EKTRLEHQREIRNQLEQINRTLSARLNELEHRLETRFERMGQGRMPLAAGAAPVRTEPVVQPAAPMHEHAAAEQAREHQAQMREEERLREERMREDRIGDGRERAQAGERPAESGWRKWF